MEPPIYIRLKKKKITSPGCILSIQDVCQYTMQNRFPDIGGIPVYEVKIEHGSFAVLEAIDIIRLIQEQYPHLDIRNTGPLHTIIEVKGKAHKPHLSLVILVWLLLFIGSGLAIMNFHADVSMQAVHERIYFLLTGEKSKSPLFLQIPYSIGIGVGMILFFNHMFKRRFNEEPSPMELEMYMYQETIDQYVINDEKQKVDKIKHDQSI
ncbi:stage V sporulation protein AA [Hazenella sp. IB182357]|uniref:Stage V sporulation protein AA n=1 Tax=Polycladospora coralii TaxID=2771432 RepID=A0A926N6I3_9BACL|nr:stage V sporulation protein AA [Polycladospora coralii]MBD1372964.1 stage V sporulation protein AA [Polycladospora coralii]MBS7530979.1 stage V sporulation protein AA [Polycladospora coralii]